MASAYFSANVTKYNAGGSGDNYIPDGYIKTVEKVWMDTYTIAFTLTKTTLDIAVLPPNKKITSIQVMIETSASQTNGTLALGFSTDAAVGVLKAPGVISHNLTCSTLSMPQSNVLNAATALVGLGDTLSAWQKVTSGTQCTITLQFNNWTMTTGTVKTIVRYT